MKRYGCTKGALSRAAEDAILNWVSTAEKENPAFEGDPVKAIEGLLKDVDVDSVTLQHEIPKLWAKLVVRKCPSFYDLAGTGAGEATVEDLKKELDGMREGDDDE